MARAAFLWRALGAEPVPVPPALDSIVIPPVDSIPDSLEPRTDTIPRA
jgi:hypothetical protein